MPRLPVLAPLAGAGLFGLTAQFLLYGQPPGINVALAFVAFLLVLRSVDPGRQMRRREALLPGAALLLAALCAIREEAPLVALNVSGVLALSVATVAARSGVPVQSLPLLRGTQVLATALMTIATTGWTIVRDERVRVRSGGAPTFGRAASYAGGALLGTPLLGVFALLFASADAVFARSLDDLVRHGLEEVPGRVLLGLLATWVIGGAIVSEQRRSAVDLSEPRPRLLGPDPALVVLALVDALFAFFVALQIAYLFGGRDTVAAAGVTYSAYARRGFFELIAVGALAAALLVVLEVVILRRGRAFIALGCALVVLTAVVLASAVHRLDLYQQAYGWTEQRLYAAAILAFLALALTLLMWGLVRGRTLHLGAPLGAAGLVVVVALNVMGPVAFVALANTDRTIDPSRLPEDASRTLDVRYLVSLGDGAVPTLVARADDLPDADRGAVLGLLNATAFRRDLRDPTAWQSWNLDRERARAALRSIASAPSGRAGLK